MDNLDNQIADQIRGYLDGRVRLDALYEWIAHNTWDIHLSEETGTQDLAYETQLALAELSAGDIDEVEFRSQLTTLIRRTSPSADADKPSISVTSWSNAGGTYSSPSFVQTRFYTVTEKGATRVDPAVARTAGGHEPVFEPA